MKFKYIQALRNIRKLLVLTIIPLLLTACAYDIQERPDRIMRGYQLTADVHWSADRYSIVMQAKKQAKEKCQQFGLSLEIFDEGMRNTHNSIYYVLDFDCYNPAIRDANARAERQRLDAQRAEQDRQVELKRQIQAAEWERGAPQREENARAWLAKERSRLNGICPIYYIARQSCANSGNGFDRCMMIRIGRSYSPEDDRTCFYR
jgi:hypothetical protein